MDENEDFRNNDMPDKCHKCDLPRLIFTDIKEDFEGYRQLTSYLICSLNGVERKLKEGAVLMVHVREDNGEFHLAVLDIPNKESLNANQPIILRGKDAEDFEKQDKEPLSEEQKVDLAKCRLTYQTSHQNKVTKKVEP
jgi:hypothetical protein